MITCAEARKVLYDIETSGETSPEVTEPGSKIALAKAHVMVCVACSEYFEREKAFIATVRDRIQSIGSPAPKALVAFALEATAKARLEEYTHPKRSHLRGFRGFFRRLFARNR